MRKYIMCALTLTLLSISAQSFPQVGKEQTRATKPAKRAAKGPSAEEGKLVTLEKQAWEVAKKKDWKAYDKLLSPDFVWVDDGGVIAGRSEFITYFANIDLTDHAMEDAMVTLFGPNVGLVTYKVTEKGSFKGEPLPSKPSYVGSAYLKRGGKWVNVFTQTTLAR